MVYITCHCGECGSWGEGESGWFECSDCGCAWKWDTQGNVEKTRDCKKSVRNIKDNKTRVFP